MGHPRGLYVLFFTEMWERFSYYGMRSLLVLYMVQGLHIDVGHASALYGLYTGLVYLTPAAGGLIADRYLGQHGAILVGGLLMAIGHFAMMLSPLPCFIIALGFIVLGCGLFKPSISVQVGALYRADDPRRESAYSFFYAGINLGGFLAPLVCGTLGQRLGWHYGFGAAGIGMLIALVVYARGRRYLVPAEPTAKRLPGAPPAEKLSRAQWKRIAALALLGVFGNIAFWATFEQAGTSLTLFAEQSTDLNFPALGQTLPSSWLQMVNPLCIFALTPLFAWAWTAMARRGFEPSTPAKFIVGLMLVACGFGVMVRAGALADGGAQVSPMWLVVTYLLNTCAELCISPVGLAVVTRLAPRDYLSWMMGMWLASVAVANFIGGQFASGYGESPHAAFFMGPVWMASLSALALLCVVRPLKRMMRPVL